MEDRTSLEEAFEQVSQAQVALIKAKEELEEAEKLFEVKSDAINYWKERCEKLTETKSSMFELSLRKSYKLSIIEKLIARGECNAQEAKLISQVIQTKLDDVTTLDHLDAVASKNIQVWKNTFLTDSFHQQCDKYAKKHEETKTENTNKVDNPKRKKSKEELEAEFANLLGRIFGDYAEVKLIKLGEAEEDAAV